MKAVQWFGPRDVRVSEVAPPQQLQPRDAIVRVTCAAICGTDLHPYRGEIPDFLVGNVMGHEFTGIIEAIDPHVEGLRLGDRVLASDVIACGDCWYCRQGWHYQCKHVSLFGYGTVVGNYIAGGQAEFVRVPFADEVLMKIPATLEDEQALFIGDILSTGFMGVEATGFRPGAVVAVVGCGPVGLCAIQSAYVLGASQVLALDVDPARQMVAGQLNALVVPFAEQTEAVERIRELTSGRGADAVLEAVGSSDALSLAMAIARPRGSIVAVGAPQTAMLSFAAQSAFGRELTFRYVVGDPIAVRERVLPLVERGRLNPAKIISHRLSLSEAVAAYERFDRHEAVKVVLLPGGESGNTDC